MRFINRSGGAGKSRPRRVTDAQHKRSMTFFTGASLIIAGAICLAVGAFAWQLPTPEPVRVTAAVPAVLPNSSVFDSGVTLFANVPDHRNPPARRAFGCRVSSPDKAPAEALVRPVPELVGSRVLGGLALTAVIDLGHPGQGAKLVCAGPAATASPSLWVLPSTDEPSGQPLAFVVGGLLLIGLGALVHPRTRSI